MINRTIKFKDAIREAVEEEMNSNPHVVLIGGNIFDSMKKPVLAGLEDKFPGRIMNYMPLVEEMFGGIALGAALGGLKPVIQMDHPALMLLMLDGIYHLGGWPYRFLNQEGPGAVFRVGLSNAVDAGADISAAFMAHVLHLPNVRIAVPGSAYFAKGLLKRAIRENRTTVFFEAKELYEDFGEVPDGEYLASFGSSTMARAGTQVSIITWANSVKPVKKAAEILAREGINPEVLILHTLNPLDIASIWETAQKTEKVVIVEEDMERGGCGAEIALKIIDSHPHCRIRRVASKNVPVPPWNFKQFIVPTANDIANACRLIIGG